MSSCATQGSKVKICLKKKQLYKYFLSTIRLSYNHYQNTERRRAHVGTLEILE